jgi:hypothetical protein
VSIKRKPDILPISTLSLKRQYQQVKSYSTVGRALSPYYANSAENQGTRWHIWFDGKDVVSMVCSGKGNKSSWESGPTVTPADIAGGDGIVAGLGTLLSSKKGGVGVIFHSADCSVLNYVKEAYDSTDKMAVIQALSVENPSSVILGDVQNVVEAHRWRPMSVPGASKGRFALFRLSNRDMTAAGKLGQLDGNFSVAVRSAHMEALAVGQGMAGLLDAENAPAGSFGRILVYYYRRSTMLAVYNAQGVLAELRLLPQAEGGCPQTLRNDFSLMLQKAPSPEMLVTVFQCAEGVDALVEELGAVKSVAGVTVSLQVLERAVFPEFCKSAGLPIRQTGEFLPMEFAIEYPEWLVSHGIGGKTEEAITIAMAGADFAQNSAEGRRSVPTPTDLKFFLFGKFLKFAAVIGLIGWAGWSGWSAWQMYRSEAWTVDMNEVQQVSEKVASLNQQKALAQELQVALKDKPGAPFAMEVALVLFASPEEALLDQLTITFEESEGDMGEAAKKQIKLSFGGVATARGISLLNRLRNQQYLTSVVKNAGDTFKVSELVGDPKFSFSEQSIPSDANGQSSSYKFSFTGECLVPIKPANQGEAGMTVEGDNGEIVQ